MNDCQPPRAAPSVADADVTPLLGPLNAVDFPNYLIHRTEQVVQILADVGHLSVKLGAGYPSREIHRVDTQAVKP